MLQALGSAERMGAVQKLPLGLPPDSFHTINPGVDFYQAFRMGMVGPFESFTPLSLRQRVFWRLGRWRLNKWNFIKRAFKRRQRYFVLW